MNPAATFVCTALSFVAAATVPAVAGSLMPDTAAGRCAAAFLAAFNADDEDSMRAFEEQYRAKSALERRSIDDRLTMVRDLRAKWGSLELQRVISGDERNLDLLVRAGRTDQLYCLGFELEQQPPHGLLGIRIEGPIDIERGAALSQPLEPSIRQRVVDRAADELIRAYVFEDIARQMAEDLHRRLGAGEYEEITTAHEFARRLTEDLRAISHDRHLAVRPRAATLPEHGPEAPPGARDLPGRGNYGFEKVEILAGNVGYIKLNGFAGGTEGHPTAAAAMAFVAHTDALIFDLRENGGGSPDMIMFLSGYLFDEPVHLNSFHNRSEGTVQDFYSAAEVPGPRYGPRKPVYVLTSAYTFSGAEEFTYNLKNLNRATIVGRTTGGGAHPVQFYTINKQFEMTVPYARAVNPITKTNWEGTGVTPDVDVPADQALDTAHDLALKAVQPGEQPPTVPTPGVPAPAEPSPTAPASS